jgi:hypothetical protein
MSNQRVVVLTDDEPGDELEKVRVALAEWIGAGAQPWEMPAVAAHFVLDCHGCESVSVGTWATLLAVSDECEECCGEGVFRDESHPAAGSTECDRCKGHGRVPKPVEHPEGITDDQVEKGAERMALPHPLAAWSVDGQALLRRQSRACLEAALFPGDGEQ